MDKIDAWKKFQEESSIAQLDYINYLIDSDIFFYLYEDVLKKHKYPIFKEEANKDSLEAIKNRVIVNTKDLLTGVNLDVKWLDSHTFNDIKHKYGLDYHGYVMAAAHEGTIFDIPIRESETYTSYIDCYNGSDENFNDVLFRRIGIISDEDKDIIESIYFHELGHALITRNINMCKNLLLDEYVPQCLEMFYNYFILGDEKAFVKKLLPKMETRARRGILLSRDHSYISPFDKNDLVYMIALFLSCITFEKYVDFNDEQKKEMQDDFRKVLNGTQTIEDFMKKYEINFDNDEAVKLYKRSTERVLSYTLK